MKAFTYNFFIILFSIQITSCTRPVDSTSKIKISFNSLSSNNQKTSTDINSNLITSQSISTLSNPQSWNSSLNPTSIGQVNCVLIAVGGPEPDMKRNRCYNSTSEYFLGRWIGGVPVDFSAMTPMNLFLEVPSGPQRQIFLIGFKSQNNACKNFRNFEMEFNNLSQPILLGSVTQDLSPGDVPVNLNATVNATSAKMDRCEGPEFGLVQRPFYFGDKPSTFPDVTINNEVSTSANFGAAHGKVTFINLSPAFPNTDAVQFNLGGSMVSQFNAGAEVMFHITGSKLNTASPHPDMYACGYKMENGRYGFARIKSVDAGGSILYLHRGSPLDQISFNPITNTNDGGYLSAIQSRLANTALSTNEFCYMQIVKIPHFYNLNLTGNLNVNPFDFSFSNGGGILAFRVNGKLSISQNANILATGRGFSGGMILKNGDGIWGEMGGTCGGTDETYSGGHCGSGINGAGGGGHAVTSGLIFNQPSGGSGGYMSPPPTNIAKAVGDECSNSSCYGTLEKKIFMGGGGGGSSDYNGGNGGGIIMVFAREIEVHNSGTNCASNCTSYLASKGESGITSASVSSGGSGGGAGGSILLNYQTLIEVDNMRLGVSTDGAIGGGGYITSTFNGGGGAAGRSQIKTCITLPLSANMTQMGGTPGPLGSGSGSLATPGRDGTLLNLLNINWCN